MDKVKNAKCRAHVTPCNLNGPLSIFKWYNYEIFTTNKRGGVVGFLKLVQNSEF